MRKFTKDLEKTIHQKTEKAIYSRKYDVECPKCKSQIKVTPGKNVCPSCANTIDFDLKIN